MSTLKKKTRTSALSRRTAGNSLTAVARRATAKRLVARRVGRGRRMVRNRSRYSRRARVRYARRYGKKHDNFSKSKTQIDTSKVIGGTLVSDKLRVRMPWKFSMSDSTTAGGVDHWSCKLNSIFDCGGVLATNHAQGYTRYFALYSRAIVRASSIKFKLWADSAGDAEPLNLTVTPCTSTQLTAIQSISDIYALQNQPHAKNLTFIPAQTGTHISHYAHVQMLATGTDTTDLLASGNYFQATGADPTSVYYWSFAVYNMSGTTTNNYQLEAEVTYYVEWYQPIVNTTQTLTDQHGNDYAGTLEQWKEESKAWLRKPIVKQLVLQPRKVQEEKKEEPDYDLVKVPKKAAVSSKK